MLVVLVTIAIIAVDFLHRLRELPSPVSHDALANIVASIDEFPSGGSSDTSLIHLNPPAAASCDAGPSPRQTLDRPVVAFVLSDGGDVTGTFARRCGMIDLVLAESMSLDAVWGAVTALPQPILPVLSSRADAPPFFHVLRLRSPVSAVALEELMGDEARLNGVLFDLASMVARNPAIGICLDLSPVPGIDAALVTQAMDALHDGLGIETCVIGPMDAPFWDDVGLVGAIDLAVAKAFVDPATPTAAPASPAWLETHLARVTAQIPDEKLVIALGSFGLVWQSGRAARDIVSYAEAMDRMAAAGGIAYLPELGTVRARLVDESRQVNDIWLQDGAVFRDQIRRLGLAQAVAIWPLGHEDPVVWALLDPQLSPAAAIEVLERPILLDEVVLRQGRGPFVTRAAAADIGLRTLSWDMATGAILSQTYSAVPRPHRISFEGTTSPLDLHLTFDGMPDRHSVDALMEALSAADVRATFFIDVRDILADESVVASVLTAGHEIGMRLAQPGLSVLGPAADIRHNGGQLALMDAVGVRTLFVRPAGRIADQKEFHSYARVIERGYLAVSPSNVAPYGSFDPAAFVSQIREETDDNLSGIMGFELGPNTKDVVALLPDILSGLAAEGFQFTALGEVAGLALDEVMPPIGESRPWRDALALRTLDFYLFGLTTMFLVLMVFAAVRSMIYVGLALWRGARTEFDPDFCPPVTVIVPAYNEQLVIVNCIESLLASDYPDLRIVVVDDGSADRTCEKVMTFFSSDRRVALLHEPNSGKWHAANFALFEITTPIFIIADADSLFFPDTIRWLVQQFKDERVGAVAGLVEVGNRQNFLTACQALEYIVSQSVMRRAYEMFEGILVVPGAVGAWRTEAVHAAQDFSGETITEDADLTVAVHRAGYRVRFQEQARAVTEAPDKVRAFMRQRLRWTFGMFEVSWKHRGAITGGRPVGISIVDAIWFGLISSLLSPVVDLLLVLLIANAIIGAFMGEATAISGLPIVVIASYFLLTGLDFVNTIVAFRLERRFDWRLLALVPLLRFGYRQLLYISTINAIWHALIGQMAGWNKLDRTGGVFNRPQGEGAMRGGRILMTGLKGPVG